MAIVKNGPYHYFSLLKRKNDVHKDKKGNTICSDAVETHVFLFLHTQHEQRALQYITKKKKKQDMLKKDIHQQKTRHFFL